MVLEVRSLFWKLRRSFAGLKLYETFGAVEDFKRLFAQDLKKNFGKTTPEFQQRIGSWLRVFKSRFWGRQARFSDVSHNFEALSRGFEFISHRFGG